VLIIVAFCPIAVGLLKVIIAFVFKLLLYLIELAGVEMMWTKPMGYLSCQFARCSLSSHFDSTAVMSFVMPKENLTPKLFL